MKEEVLTVVMALIKNDEGKVLAQLRNDISAPSTHNKWELPGGKVEFRETPEQAVVREVKEETGLDVSIESFYSKVFVEFWERADKETVSKCVLLPYVCKIIGGQLHLSPEDPKIYKHQFLNKNEIEKLEWGSEIDKNLLLELAS